MSLIVTTNRHWRELTSWHELTSEEQMFHDYADESDLFVRYRGMVEPLGSFVRISPMSDLFRQGWEGACASGLWFGWVIRMNREHDAFQVGAYREIG